MRAPGRLPGAGALTARADLSTPPAGGLGVVAVLGVGLVIGVQIVMLGVAAGAVLFAGPLAHGVALGTAATLAGGVVATLAIGLAGDVPSAVAEVQEHGLAALAATLAAAAAPLALADAQLATAFAIIVATTVLTAALLRLLGRARLGGVVGFFPYPVLGGFLAGSGWLLTSAALGIVLGTTSDVAAWVALAEPGAAARAAPMAVLAVAMLAASRRAGHPMAPLAVLVVALLGHAGAVAAGLVARPPAASATGLGAIVLPDPSAVAWDRVRAATPSIAAVAALSVAGALLNVGALAAEVRMRVDTDRELRVTGLANFGMAAVGAGPGFVSLGMTSMAHRLGVRSRGVCLVAAAVIGTALVFSGQILSWVPPFVTGGLIAFLGLGFLLDWVWATRTRMPRGDWLIVLSVLCVTAFVGFVAAIGLGIALATALYVLDTVRASVIRFDRPLTAMHSPRDRPQGERRLLDAHAGSTRIVALEGNLFFGTGEVAIRRLHALLGGPTRALVLDLSRVHMIDVTAATTLAEFARAASEANLDVTLVSVPPTVERALRRAGLPGDSPPRLPSLDRALESAEDAVLQTLGEPSPGDPLALLRRAARGDAALLEAVLSGMERTTFAEGERIFEAGAPSDCLYLILEGQVWVDDPSRVGVPLRPFRAGTVLGDVALLLDVPRPTAVDALAPTVLLRLDAATLEAWERDAPDRALVVHRLIELTLIDKLLSTNRAVALTRH